MKIRNRKDVPEEYKWKLEDIFPSNDAWEECFFALSERMGKIASYKGRLSDEDALYECLILSTSLSHDLSRLYQYARMRRDEDAREPLYQGMTDRADALAVRLSSLSSFVTPELAAMSTDVLKALAAKKRFADYSVMLGEIVRNKEIILSDKEEKLLREAGIFADTNDEVFSMFDNADIKFEPVTDDKGRKVEMSHGNYSLLLQNPSQEVRKAAFESMFGAYRDHINMLAANYAGNVKKDWFFAKVRGFSSCMDRSMFAENVPSACYKKLLEAVGRGTGAMHRYIALRRRMLGVKTLNMYDLHVPLVDEAKLAMPYEKAVETVKSALKVMGSEYSDILASAFTDGWIDVYENRGKRSGAYSWGCYGVHPFVLLNYTETSHDVFTIAHELGHAIHSYYSNENQPEEKAGYEIFVAEIASTVNEVLLLKYLLSAAEGKVRTYLLSYYLDMFRTTLFRQTMFAEFEAEAHAMAERGEPLNKDNLSALYYDLNKKYYGEGAVHDQDIEIEWARIPHFYNAFYVYKYATGITAAIAISDKIIKEGAPAVERYFAFLRGGCSKDPVTLLKEAGADLTSKATFEAAMQQFLGALEEFTSLS